MTKENKPEQKKCDKCRICKPQKEHRCPFDNSENIVCNCCHRCRNICIRDQFDLKQFSGEHK